MKFNVKQREINNKNKKNLCLKNLNKLIIKIIFIWNQRDLNKYKEYKIQILIKN